MTDVLGQSVVGGLRCGEEPGGGLPSGSVERLLTARDLSTSTKFF